MHGSGGESGHSANGLNGLASAAQLDLDFARRGVSVLERLDIEEIALPATIVKRDGRLVAFDPMRIERAISRCFAALARQPSTPLPDLPLPLAPTMSPP